jgi:phage terminase large subunit-like protein
MDELDFVRLHCNGWTQARNVFIPAMPWKRCTSDAQLRRERIFVAVDVGLTHDTSAIGWSQQLPRNDSGKLPESEDGEPPPPEVLTRVKVWSANPEHERDRSTRHVFVPGGRVELELLFEFILELQEDYGIAELVYDPTFFEGEAQRLSRRRIKCAPVYQNGVLPAMAYQRFYQDVKEGRALHADDPVFTRHVLAAAGVKTERGWRVSELRSSEVIDALQAGAMSHWRAARHRGSVYQTRGVQTVSAPPREVEPDPH